MTEPSITHAILSAKIDTLETQVEALTKSVNDLVAMKHRALGVFWLGSIIITAAFTALISSLGSWLRGGT